MKKSCPSPRSKFVISRIFGIHTVFHSTYHSGLRRVVQLVPGQLLYRHDPVTKFELYREEWARRPAPGEEKRLALRWKVREYMLSFDPRTSARPYAVHPRDWSPRPYID
ncbi:unnamed protein product [Heligmosomoides polygyrus]|uniref:Centriolar and ciliogenesis-associated protein HYLS1 C-terminal domain-containing protein n=1 Tax=Heligmosomoides polygyrus TaxID=6339 RepID=A0A3P8E7Y4_HELPZ|nr:unnamed protein product [Heligmosomoides polygyrus]